MKKFSMIIAGLGIVAAAVPATAFAAPAPAPRFGYDQGWQNINARQARLDANRRKASREEDPEWNTAGSSGTTVGRGHAAPRNAPEG